MCRWLFHASVATRWPVPTPHASRRIGELFGAGMQLPISRAVEIAFDAARYDFDRPVMPIGVLNQRRNQQRHILHQAVHAYPSFSRYRPVFAGL